MVEQEKNKEQYTRPPNTQEERWFDYVDNLPFLSDEYLTKFADKLLPNLSDLTKYLALDTGLKLLVY